MGLYGSPKPEKEAYDYDLQNLGVYKQEIKTNHRKRNIIIVIAILAIILIIKTI